MLRVSFRAHISFKCCIEVGVRTVDLEHASRLVYHNAFLLSQCYGSVTISAVVIGTCVRNTELGVALLAPQVLLHLRLSKLSDQICDLYLLKAPRNIVSDITSVFMATLPTPQPTHHYSLMAVKMVMRLGPKCTTVYTSIDENVYRVHRI